MEKVINELVFSSIIKMALFMKYEKGYQPEPNEVTICLLPALASAAVTVQKSDWARLKDMDRDYHILGVMNYRGIDYNILLSEQGIARAEVQTPTLFDVMGTDYVDGILRFLEVGMRIVPGHSIPFANLAFEPDPERLAFLRGIARRFKDEMPRLETLALAHQADRHHSWVYEIL